MENTALALGCDKRIWFYHHQRQVVAVARLSGERERGKLRISLCKMRHSCPTQTRKSHYLPEVVESYKSHFEFGVELGEVNSKDTYTTDNVMFYWQTPGVAITHDKEIALNTELPQFSIVENITESCNGTMDVETPKFACIKAYFTLKRDIGYYIIQVYVPSILIVTLSWVSFWLDLEAIPARVSLGVLTVLTLNTHGSHIQSQLPKVSYIKAIDVWIVSSLIFVFAALLEFAYVNVLARRGDKEILTSQIFRIPVEGKELSHSNGKPKRHMTVGGPAPSRMRARRVDKISRILFPSSFLLFNMAYWVFYTQF